MVGGGISTNRISTLTFDGNISFTNNEHNTDKLNINKEWSYGGAIYLDIQSSFSILLRATVCCKNKHANLGGAIYVYDYIPLMNCAQTARYKKCFFQLAKSVQRCWSQSCIQGQLYWWCRKCVILDNCKLTGQDTYKFGEVFLLVHIEDNDTDYKTTSKISSDPFCICPCNFSYYSVSDLIYQVYPGETSQVSVVKAGQRKGTVSSIVRRNTARNSIAKL